MCTAAAVCREAQDNGKLALDSLDFGRRAAVESELDRSDALNSQNALFDESGHILIYPTLVHTVDSMLEMSCCACVSNAIFLVLLPYAHNKPLFAIKAGIKMINIETNRVLRVLGKVESGERFLRLHLFQGTPVVDKQFLLSKGMR